MSIIFRDTVGCSGIQHKLRDLVYGMSGVYSSGLVTCIIAAVMETLLLCRKRSSKVSVVSNITLGSEWALGYVLSVDKSSH